jgi:hypothetical protein
MFPRIAFPKSAFTVVTALVLAASYTSAQARAYPNGSSAQTKVDPTHCVSSTMEEGARSAFPAWDVCSGR